MASSSHVPPPPPTTQRPPWAEEPPGPPEGPVDEEKQDKIECEEKGNGTSEERDKPEVKDKVSPEAPRMGTLRERLEFVRSAEAGIPCGFRRQAVLLPGRLYVSYNEEVIFSKRVVFYRLLGDMWAKLSHVGFWEEDPAGTR